MHLALTLLLTLGCGPADDPIGTGDTAQTVGTDDALLPPSGTTGSPTGTTASGTPTTATGTTPGTSPTSGTTTGTTSGTTGSSGTSTGTTAGTTISTGTGSTWVTDTGTPLSTTDTGSSSGTTPTTGGTGGTGGSGSTSQTGGSGSGSNGYAGGSGAVGAAAPAPSDAPEEGPADLSRGGCSHSAPPSRLAWLLLPALLWRRRTAQAVSTR